jgi:hypothetical protein
MSARIDVFRALLDRFADLHRFDLQRCVELLRTVRPHIERLQTSQVAQRLKETPAFNVFEITKRTHYEVTTHSAFLANLLDPLASHGQGNLFLSRFLQLIKVRLPRWKCPPADACWQIACETDYIDICLTHRNETCCVIIEHKWNTPAREDQTLKYWQRKWGEYNRFVDRLPVIYLTRDGSAPIFSAKRLPRSFVDGLILMSYQTEIYDLLMSLSFSQQSEIFSPVVDATVRQYLLTIAGGSHDY